MFSITCRSEHSERRIISTFSYFPKGVFRRTTAVGISIVQKAVAKLGEYDHTEKILTRPRLPRDTHSSLHTTIDGSHRQAFCAANGITNIGTQEFFAIKVYFYFSDDFLTKIRMVKKCPLVWKCFLLGGATSSMIREVSTHLTWNCWCNFTLFLSVANPRGNLSKLLLSSW